MRTSTPPALWMSSKASSKVGTFLRMLRISPPSYGLTASLYPACPVRPQGVSWGPKDSSGMVTFISKSPESSSPFEAPAISTIAPASGIHVCRMSYGATSSVAVHRWLLLGHGELRCPRPESKPHDNCVVQDGGRPVGFSDPTRPCL